MTSLVEELQRDALDSSVSVLDLLRKALVVATKLNIDEFKEWIELELKGYSDEKTIPDYRNVIGSLKWKNYSFVYPNVDWVDVVTNDTDFLSIVSRRRIEKPISEIHDLILDKSTEDYVNFGFDNKVQDMLNQILKLDTKEYVLRITVLKIKQILHSVRTIILRWSLKLGEDGILGDGMTFNNEEKSIASHKNYTYIIYTNGDIKMNENRSINLQSKGNVQFNGVLASGDITGDIHQNIQDLQTSQSEEFIQLIEKLKILKELFETDTELSNDDKEMALEQIAVLENEAKNPDKQSSLKPVKLATAFLKGVTDNLTKTTVLVKSANELIPAISQLFHHIHQHIHL
jgi:hypothetical protein